MFPSFSSLLQNHLFCVLFPRAAPGFFLFFDAAFLITVLDDISSSDDADEDSLVIHNWNEILPHGHLDQVLDVAVDVDGFKQTLLYTNKEYAPDNLGQFIADAGLSSHTGFSKSAFCKGESLGYSSYRKVTVSNIKSLVSSYIFAEESALPASFSSYKSGTVHVTFTSNSNPTGSVINFGVSNNGYLYVKMASGKSFTFHIGESSASSFINSVTGK